MSTNNQIDLIEFPAKDPEELKKITTFFSTVFEWNYKNWGDGYSDTQDSGLASGVNASPSGRPTMPMVVLYADDLETTQARIIQAGGKITQEIYSFPGGKRFHFVDPVGHELAVWSK